MHDEYPTVCDSCLPEDAEVYTVGIPDGECDFCGRFGRLNKISKNYRRMCRAGVVQLFERPKDWGEIVLRWEGGSFRMDVRGLKCLEIQITERQD